MHAATGEVSGIEQSEQVLSLALCSLIVSFAGDPPCQREHDSVCPNLRPDILGSN